jgi:hypothetical protein
VHGLRECEFACSLASRRDESMKIRFSLDVGIRLPGENMKEYCLVLLTVLSLAWITGFHQPLL